jgi:hypothetical protein
MWGCEILTTSVSVQKVARAIREFLLDGGLYFRLKVVNLYNKTEPTQFQFDVEFLLV